MMKRTLLFMLLGVYSITVMAQNRINPRRNVRLPQIQRLQTGSNGQTLPIRRVILYSNGVAYIERRGIVSSATVIDLSFKQSQVDDVLKSMVVLDLGQGRIGAVSYNSSAPPSARMAEIPFNVEAETSDETGGLAGVLAQLQGAKVAVTSIKGSAIGSILTLEKRNLPAEKDKPQMQTRFLVIASASGELASFDLSEVRSIKLLDEGTQKDVQEFANATASARRRDAKTITVTSEGTGQREMMVSYTIAAPIWKTTYRVVLDAEGKPFFQGWAIVDNVSDENWQNVQLSLVSGSPISFIQPIQKPLYRYRPIIPIPEDLKLDPQVYEEGGGIGHESGNGNGNGDVAPPAKTLATVNVTAESPAVEATQSMLVQQNYLGKAEATTEISDALNNNRSGVETAATGAEIGDLFEYRIAQPITVSRDRSALIPIVQTKMDGERVSIYNESARRERPMSGMLLKNLTPLTFESGSLTVIDNDAYAGEALMERLKPKEQRLISFALDLGTLVNTKQEEDREPARLIKAVNGTFQVHYFTTNKKIYTLQNQTDRDRVVYIEHPIRRGWELTDESTKPAIITARYYRFRVELKPFDKIVLPVTEKQALMDSYVIRDLSSENLEMFVARRYINDATRLKIEKLLDLKAKINQIAVKLEALKNEEEKISEDQKRLRENIETLTKTPEAKQLIARYVAKANDQETRLEQISKERESLQAQREQLESELANAIRTFEI